MAFRDYWRGDRERFGAERHPERWRTGADWRDEGNEERFGRRPGGDYGTSDRDYYSAEGRRYAGGAWNPGRSEYYGGEYSQPYRGGDWSRYGAYEQDEGRKYGGGQGQYGGGGQYGGYGEYGGDYERGAYGPGSYRGRSGRDIGLERSGGYGGYGGYGGRFGEVSGRDYASQQFRGRGPRGYQRSDERIREDVCDRLTDDDSVDASNLEVNVKNCEVTLSGSVSSREEKRRAEDIAEEISGVKDVHNNVRVSTEQRTGEQTAAQQAARH